MIINSNCTILTKKTDPFTRSHVWVKYTYNNVYFEEQKKDSNAAPDNSCYCCIYEILQPSAIMPGDVIVNGLVEEVDIDITEIKAKYETYTVTEVTFCRIGKNPHTEIVGC